MSEHLLERDAAPAPTATEHLDVVVVGAGLSGVGITASLLRRRPTDGSGGSVAVLEARQALGGTWDLFRYPGIRSDSDMYSFAYRDHPWTGERSLADGASIRDYVAGVAAQTGVEPLVRFGHRLVCADFSTREARWTLEVDRSGPDGGVERTRLTCSFLVAATGYYRYATGYTPELPGLDSFAGDVVHPQHWPGDLDVTGRRVVVVGSGATAVTLVPALAPVAEHVTMLQRSPSWVLALPRTDAKARALLDRLPGLLATTVVRWRSIVLATALYQMARRQPARTRAMLMAGVRRALPAREGAGYDVDVDFTPAYDPWDQRLCFVPDGDLFKALRGGRASVVTDRIETFTPTGVRLASGRQLDADVVVTATGLELQLFGGAGMSVDGEVVDVASTVAYRGVMLSGVPNFVFAIGYTNNSWTLKVDLVADFLLRLLRRARARGADAVTPVDPPSADLRPLLDLQAGYVRRGLHLMPRTGARAPWRLRQNYLVDLVALRFWPLGGRGLAFTRAGQRASRVSDRRAGDVATGGPESAEQAADRAGQRAGETCRRGVPVSAATRRYRFDAGTAVLTGAASGIGSALADGLARRGSALVLVDRDEAGLAATAARVRAAHPGLPVSTHRVDLADRAATIAVLDAVLADHPAAGGAASGEPRPITAVLNVAGVALGGRFTEVSLEDVDWLLDVNLRATLTVTHHLLPALLASPGSHLVNTSSVFGIIAPAGQVAYATSKFAVRGFTEALRAELDGRVGVTCVHPGGVNTNIARRARAGANLDPAKASAAQQGFQRLLTITPERAAAEILRGMERRRPRVLVGASAVVPDALARLSPSHYHRLVTLVLSRGSRGAREG